MIAETILRTARKPWRCVCADEILGYRVRGTFARGWSERRIDTLAEAEEVRAQMLTRPATCNADTGEPVDYYDDVEILPRPNPNYRPDCAVEIAPGDRYVEYVGEASAWESGSRYCLPCGEAVWAVTADA